MVRAIPFGKLQKISALICGDAIVVMLHKILQWNSVPSRGESDFFLGLPRNGLVT